MRVSAEVKLILSVHPGQRTEQQLAKVSIPSSSLNGRTLEQNKTQVSPFCFLDSSAFSELSSDSIGFFKVFFQITLTNDTCLPQTACCQVFGTDARCMSL